MGKFCGDCGEKLKSENAVICVACGAGQAKPVQGAWSTGQKQTFFVLSALLPLIGGIIGFAGLFSDANRGEGLKLIVASFIFWILWTMIFMSVMFI